MLRICLLLVLFGAINAYGHEGRLDRNGGHIGESGTYHYHNRQLKKLEIVSPDKNNKKVLKITLVKEVRTVKLSTIGLSDTSEVIASQLKQCEEPVGESKMECIAKVKDLIVRTEKAGGAGKNWSVDLAGLQLERSIPRILRADYDYRGLKGAWDDPATGKYLAVPEDGCGSYAILAEYIWLRVEWTNQDGTADSEDISIHVSVRETRKKDGPSERKITNLSILH